MRRIILVPNINRNFLTLRGAWRTDLRGGLVNACGTVATHDDDVAAVDGEQGDWVNGIERRI